MADVMCNDVCLWINHVFCGVTRAALLGLEPGARIWLEVDGAPILFERMQDGSDGRSTRGLKPVGPTAELWRRRFRDEPGSMVELEFVERPTDLGKAADRVGREVTE